MSASWYEDFIVWVTIAATIGGAAIWLMERYGTGKQNCQHLWEHIGMLDDGRRRYRCITCGEEEIV